MNVLFDVTTASIRDRFVNFFQSIGAIFSGFRVNDVFDILLLAVLLFFAFRFLNNRKAGALLIGTFVCVVLFVVAVIFDLRSVSFIFSSIFKIGAVAILIIFQTEIRDGLEKIGSGSFGSIAVLGENGKKRALYRSMIENVCAAVSSLSESKTGALIVIGRSTRLDDILQTGVPIDADVNSFLLRNLFFDKAPLHDGAVVIENGRICAAGCLLPLTRRNDVDSDLGTRHRAAIGMSEASDAVVIVVSEETGTVSVAYDCNLTRGFTAEMLGQFLRKKLLGEKPSQESDR